MKRNKQCDYPFITFVGVVFFVLYILQYTDGVFETHGCFPQLMLPCVVFSAMFFGDGVGAVFGFVAGALVDAVSAGTICYNTIMLMLLGYALGISVRVIINNNFRSAVIVTVATSAVYYFGRWCCFGLSSAVFKQKIAPSCFLTIVYSVPIYLFIYFAVRLRKKQLIKNSENQL